MTLPQGRLPTLAWASMAVLASVAFDVALHRFCGWAFAFDYFENGLPHSVFVTSGLFPVAASIGFASMFGFLARVYLGARRELGGGSLRAQRLFAPAAVVMFLGVLESAFVFPTPFRPELITAVADAVPFLLLGALLSRVPPSPADPDRGPGERPDPAGWQSMLWVAFIFVAGRYLVSYPLLRIVSGYLARPAGTLLWTIGCGLGMGAFYWLAGSAFSAATPPGKALRVGLTLGTFWLMVQLFYALISAVSISDLALRGSADTAYLVAGIYAFERLFRRAGSVSIERSFHAE